jgi:hypothetical protein
VEEAVHIILRGQEPAYLILWEGLTRHQRKTVKSVAARGGRLLRPRKHSVIWICNPFPT